MRRKEQDVFAAQLCQCRGLDIGTVAGSVGQDLYRASDLRSSVLCDLLQHQRCGNDGCDSVAALSTMAYCIAVDLVRDPSGAVCVGVSGGINGSALSCRADPWLSARIGIGSGNRRTRGIANTMKLGLRFQCGGVVNDKRAIAELYRIGSPLSKVSMLGGGSSL